MPTQQLQYNDKVDEVSTVIHALKQKLREALKSPKKSLSLREYYFLLIAIKRFLNSNDYIQKYQSISFFNHVTLVLPLQTSFVKRLNQELDQLIQLLPPPKHFSKKIVPSSWKPLAMMGNLLTLIPFAMSTSHSSSSLSQETSNKNTAVNFWNELYVSEPQKTISQSHAFHLRDFTQSKEGNSESIVIQVINVKFPHLLPHLQLLSTVFNQVNYRDTIEKLNYLIEEFEKNDLSAQELSLLGHFYYMRSTCEFLEGNVSQYFSDYLKTIKLGLWTINHILSMATDAYDSAAYTKAMLIAETGLSYFPENPELLFLKAEASLANIFITIKDFTVKEKMWEVPDTTLKEHYQEAISVLEQLDHSDHAFTDAVDQSTLRHHIADYYFLKGDYKTAETYYRKALRGAEDIQSIKDSLKKCQIFQDPNNTYTHAKKLREQGLLQIDIEDPRYLLNPFKLSHSVYLLRSLFDDNILIFSRLFQKGKALLDSEEHLASIESLEKAIALFISYNDPSYNHYIGLGYCTLGINYKKLKEYQLAKNHFEIGLHLISSLNSQLVPFFADYANTLELLGDELMAYKILDKLQELSLLEATTLSSKKSYQNLNEKFSHNHLIEYLRNMVIIKGFIFYILYRFIKNRVSTPDRPVIHINPHKDAISRHLKLITDQFSKNEFHNKQSIDCTIFSLDFIANEKITPILRKISSYEIFTSLIKHLKNLYGKDNVTYSNNVINLKIRPTDSVPDSRKHLEVIKKINHEILEKCRSFLKDHWMTLRDKVNIEKQLQKSLSLSLNEKKLKLKNLKEAALETYNQNKTFYSATNSIDSTLKEVEKLEKKHQLLIAQCYQRNIIIIKRLFPDLTLTTLEAACNTLSNDINALLSNTDVVFSFADRTYQNIDNLTKAVDENIQNLQDQQKTVLDFSEYISHKEETMMKAKEKMIRQQHKKSVYETHHHSSFFNTSNNNNNANHTDDPSIPYLFQ